jgi:tRNA dimethylallyltransferase
MNKTVIFITGPTASGKTPMAISLAKHFGCSIISADSRQCFKELTIGVAKPTVEELNIVPHYFINTHSIHEAITAATFETYALEKADELFQSNNVLILAGGTGLYIKAFLEGLDEIPPVDEIVRHQLNALYKLNGLKWLTDQIQLKDPLFASEGEMQNPQRMLRALEVLEATGRSILQFQTGTKKKRNFDVIRIGIELPREELYQRINNRVDVMMKQGLYEEAKELIPYQHLNSLQTVGYKELFDYFNGTITLDQAVNKIKQNTRHYAKRQLTWFKRDDQINWFHPLKEEELLNFIMQKIKSRN